MRKSQGTSSIKPFSLDSSPDSADQRAIGKVIRSVLVVDPDPDFSSIVSDYLKLFGYNISFKNNIEEALQLALENESDVIFLADNFNHHHPIDVLRRFKSAVPSAITVILANKGDDQLAVELLKSGADDYLSRRVKDKDILTSIANLLEKISRNGSSNTDSRTGINNMPNQALQTQLESESALEPQLIKQPSSPSLEVIDISKVSYKQMPGVSIILDDNLNVVSFNFKCAELIGYKENEMLNKPIESIIPKIFYSDLLAEIKQYNKNTEKFANEPANFTLPFELLLVTKAGQGLPVKCRIGRHHSLNNVEFNKEHYLLSIEDLSNEKSQQADLLYQSMWNNLLRAFAHRFINLKLENFSDEVTQVVSETANFFKLDRVSIFLLDKTTSKAKIYLEWLKKDVDSLNVFSKKIEVDKNLKEFSLLLEGNVQCLSPLQSTQDPAEGLCLGLSEHYAQVNTISSMVIPVFSNKKVIGWIALDHQSDDKHWKVDDTKMLEPLGSLISEVFTRRTKEEQRKVTHQKLSENHGKLSEQAFLDGLTNLANRRYFDKVLESEIRRASREKTNIALLFCDIDYFKGYNDSYGHIEGDNCLKTIAAILKQEFQRAGDFVARYGGEEFAIILSGSLANDAQEAAEKLRQQILLKNISNQGSPLEKITMSVGISSVIAPEPDDAERLISNADKALYKAKNNGRNRIEVADFSPR